MPADSAAPLDTPDRPAEWRPTWRDPKRRRREIGAVVTCERLLFSGPIPSAAERRDDALRSLLGLMRYGENEVIRFAAAKLMLEYSQAAYDAEDDEDDRPSIPLSPNAIATLNALAVARFGGDRARTVKAALVALAVALPTPEKP